MAMLCATMETIAVPTWADLVTPKVRIEPGKNYLLSFYVFTGVAPSPSLTLKIFFKKF